jgi:peptidoglycan/xylan/chitin deacetylase (PgdA/CDA1 family)
MSRFFVLNVATAGALGAAYFLVPERFRILALAGIVFLHFVIFTRGIVSGRSSLFLTVHSRGSDAKKIALTFDDGPGDATRAVLGVLREHGVRATFFSIGANIKGREDVLRAASEAGHTIGSHSFAHSRLTNFLLTGGMTAEIEKGVAAIATVIGKRPRLYRPPVGLKSPAVAAACRKLGLVCVGWRRRARDGGAAKVEPGTIVERLVAARGGEIVLLHDGVEPNRQGDRAATIAALREAIPLMKARGISFVTVDELIGEKAYA